MVVLDLTVKLTENDDCQRSETKAARKIFSTPCKYVVTKTAAVSIGVIPSCCHVHGLIFAGGN